MRNLLMGVLLGILIVAVPTAFTQQQSERIQLGTDLQLGMAKDAVISKLTEHGYVTRKLIEEGDSATNVDLSPDIWGVARSNQQAEGRNGNSDVLKWTIVPSPPYLDKNLGPKQCET